MVLRFDIASASPVVRIAMLNALRLFTIVIPAGISPTGEAQTAMDKELVGNIVHVSL